MFAFEWFNPRLSRWVECSLRKAFKWLWNDPHSLLETGSWNKKCLPTHAVTRRGHLFPSSFSVSLEQYREDVFYFLKRTKNSRAADRQAEAQLALVMKILTIVVIQNHYVTTEVMFSNNTLVMMLRYQKLDTHIDKLMKRDNVSQSRYQRKSDFSSKRLNEQFHGKSFIRKQIMLSVCQPVSRLLFQCFSFVCTMSYSYRKQAVIKALQVY